MESFSRKKRTNKTNKQNLEAAEKASKNTPHNPKEEAKPITNDHLEQLKMKFGK